MILSRRNLSASALAGVMLLVAACAPGKSVPVDQAGRALEPLTITTSSGAHVFMVEIADDDASRERGLMYRPPLADDRGMLFEFPTAKEQSFWMRNTPSSLDILYIDPKGQIVSIATRATPYSEVPIPSNGAANGVLELRAGRADEIGAKPGDTVKHNFFKP